MSYTKPTLAGYNANPPPDDGSEVAANEVRWDTHKTKLGDPLKNYADAINQAVKDAFDVQFLNAVVTVSIDYSVQASDRGKMLNVWNGATVTLPSAASVGTGFAVLVRNANGDSVVVSGAEQINGRAAYTISEGAFATFASNGDSWNAAGRSAEDPVIVDDGTLIRVTGLGFGTSGQFVDWFGPRPVNGNIDLCSEATAIYYLKTNGDRYTAGTDLSGDITASGQTTSISASASVTVGPFSTNGGRKRVSVSYAFTRTRAISNAVSYSGSAGATVLLERSFDGVTWTEIGVAESFVGAITEEIPGNTEFEPGVLQEQISGSFPREDTDNTVSATLRYRASLTSRTQHTFNSTPIGADVILQSLDLISVE